MGERKSMWRPVWLGVVIVWISLPMRLASQEDWRAMGLGTMVLGLAIIVTAGGMAVHDQMLHRRGR